MSDLLWQYAVTDTWAVSDAADARGNNAGINIVQES